MAPTIDDRYLWLGLGVFTFIAIKGVAHGLRTIVQLTEVHEPPPKPIPPPPRLGKEDAIKTESLEILALNTTNPPLRKSATKILCERFFAHSPSRARLLKELNSSDPEIKRRAELACKLLNENGLWELGLMPRRLPNASRWLNPSGHPFAPISSDMHARNVTSDSQAAALRRRRREAMVISEGGRPVSQEDVWMRDASGRLNTEEEDRNTTQEEQDLQQLLVAGMGSERQLLHVENTLRMINSGEATPEAMWLAMGILENRRTDRLDRAEANASSGGSEDLIVTGASTNN